MLSFLKLSIFGLLKSVKATLMHIPIIKASISNCKICQFFLLCLKIKSAIFNIWLEIALRENYEHKWSCQSKAMLHVGLC